MNDNYIIAAGGTGAMCARAFIYMAAAGCAQDHGVYHVLLIDKDKESDAVTACEDLLRDYDAMRTQLGEKPDTGTFPKIELHHWNFTEEIVDEYCRQTGNTADSLKNLTLNKLLNPRNDPRLAQILRSTYTEDELSADLDKGFYGHPNIGAPLFDYIQDRFLAKTVVYQDRGDVVNTFMSSLHSSLNKGKTHVYLMGSLFGGTGATVIPNVVRALRSMHDPNNPAIDYGKTNLILGGSVIMPYFRLPTCPANSVEALEKVSPIDAKFAGQTQEALSYYFDSGLLDDMMNLTLLGSSQMDITSEIFARGGQQSQHFHVVLLLAAAAANRFFADRLGQMAKAVEEETVRPMGELLVWKALPEDGGIYRTLTPEELGLGEEYDHLMAFLRFSVVVGYYMRLKFGKDADDLKPIVEVRGTARQMKDSGGRPLNPKTIDRQQIDTYYKEPVAKAGAICRGFIEFMYDISLSGFDWSCYRQQVPDQNPTTVDGMNYYHYSLGPEDKNAAAKFDQRWVDFTNLTELKQLLEAQTASEIVNNTTLNDILTYERLDSQERPAYKETRFPNSIATVYERDVLHNLGLEVNWLGRVRNDGVWFCQIYDELRKLCR